MTTSEKTPAVLSTLTLHKVSSEGGIGVGCRLIGYFVHLEDAKAAAKGKGEWGDGRIDTENHVIVTYKDPTTGLETIRRVGEEIQIFFEAPDVTRARALEKLRATGMSIAELKALGL